MHFLNAEGLALTPAMKVDGRVATGTVGLMVLAIAIPDAQETLPDLSEIALLVVSNHGVLSWHKIAEGDIVGPLVLTPAPDALALPDRGLSR